VVTSFEEGAQELVIPHKELDVLGEIEITFGAIYYALRFFVEVVQYDVGENMTTF